METEDLAHSPKANPWHPMSDPVDLKHMGKFAEEVNELGSAIARCLIQGIDECHPETGKVNREWLEDEIADVIANIQLCDERFGGFNWGEINLRIQRKIAHLRTWHEQA